MASSWPGASKDTVVDPNGPAPKSIRPGRTRVLVVDDSMVIRTLVSSWVEAEPDLELAGVACNGAEAVQVLAGIHADVCVLDLEMPVMGGLDAIPRLLRIRPNLKILVASRLTHHGAEATMRAIDAGAADCLAKPSARDPGGADAFRRELLAKARALGRSDPAAAARPQSGRPAAAVRLRPLSAPIETPNVLAVAASTGGPPALHQFLGGLTGELRQPVLIVQHMPAAFIELLAQQLSKASPLPVQVAAADMPLEPGRAYLAPGDRHLRVSSRAGRLFAELNDDPPENYCRPAADVLFRSIAKTCGRRALGVVLTGMGRDGCAGALAIVRAGGVVLAQDEPSSVVWGMPGAVVQADLASFVGPLDRLARATRNLLRGEAP